MYQFFVDNLPAIITALVTIVTGSYTLWRKVFKPILKPVLDAIKQQPKIMEDIRVIKAEVTPNGGGSLKDKVNYLGEICTEIKVKQLTIDARTKATLNCTEKALCEIDADGKATWSNDRFHELSGLDSQHTSDYDWISYIDDDERTRFLTELKSCLDMSRRLDIDTVDRNGNKIRVTGHPYRMDDSNNGFLITIVKKGEQHG